MADVPNVNLGAAPDTAKSAATDAAEKAAAFKERMESGRRAKAEKKQAEFDALPTEQKERILQAEEESRERLSAEDAAQVRILNSPDVKNDRTERSKLDIKKLYQNKRRAIRGVDGSRYLDHPAADAYSPTDTITDYSHPDAMRLFNDVGPDRHVVWKRRPEIYKDQMDEVQQVLDTFEDARIVTYKSNGKARRDQDLVAISIPSYYEEARRQVESEDYAEWQEIIQSSSQHGSVTRKTPNLEQKVEEASEAARARSQKLGIGYEGNSPTAGYALIVAERMIGNEEMEQMEARARSGNRHRAYEEEAANSRERGGGKGGKLFGGLSGAADKTGRSGGVEQAVRSRVIAAR